MILLLKYIPLKFTKKKKPEVIQLNIIICIFKMTCYLCPRCHSEFTSPTLFLRHANKTLTCEPTHSSETLDVNDVMKYKHVSSVECETCGTKFTTKYARDRHVKSRTQCLRNCTDRQAATTSIVNTNSNNTTNNNTTNNNKNTATNSYNTNSTVNSHNNITNNNNIVIQVLPWNTSNIDFLTDKDYKECIGRHSSSVSALLEKLNFNKDHEENHNIFISNIRSKHVIQYDGKQWITAPLDQTLEKFILQKELILKNWLQANKENSQQMERLEKQFMEYMEKRQVNKQVSDKVQNDVTFSLYNNRQLVKQTKNKQAIEKRNLEKKNIRKFTKELEKKDEEEEEDDEYEDEEEEYDEEDTEEIVEVE